MYDVKKERAKHVIGIKKINTKNKEYVLIKILFFIFSIFTS